MDWSKIVSTISGAAPLLGSLFGPAGTAIGTVAGAGIKLIATALGCEPTQESIAQALSSDPQALLKLQELELNAKVELQRLSVQQLSAELTDVQNARLMNMENTKTTGKRDINLYVLMWLIVGGFFVTLTLLQLYPSSTNPNAALLFGTLAAAFGAVVQFNFGTNRSSETKTAMLYNSTPNK